MFDTVGFLDAPWQALVSRVARVWRLTYLKNTRSGLWATREGVGFYPCQARHGAIKHLLTFIAQHDHSGIAA